MSLDGENWIEGGDYRYVLALASDTSIAERPRSSEIIASASLVGNGGHASQSSCRSAIAYAGSKSGLNVERKSHRLKCRPRGLAVERGLRLAQMYYPKNIEQDCWHTMYCPQNCEEIDEVGIRC